MSQFKVLLSKAPLRQVNSRHVALETQLSGTYAAEWLSDSNYFVLLRGLQRSEAVNWTEEQFAHLRRLDWEVLELHSEELKRRAGALVRIDTGVPFALHSLLDKTHVARGWEDLKGSAVA